MWLIFHTYKVIHIDSLSAAFAEGKDCNELKMEIAAKMDANGVQSYNLTITNKDEVKTEDKVVGSCEGGTKKIVYLRKDEISVPKETPGTKK